MIILYVFLTNKWFTSCSRIDDPGDLRGQVAADNSNFARIVRVDLRTSEPETPENGSWAGSKEWAKNIYPKLQTNAEKYDNHMDK